LERSEVEDVLLVGVVLSFGFGAFIGGGRLIRGFLNFYPIAM